MTAPTCTALALATLLLAPAAMAANEFSAPIEAAHNATEWRSQTAVAADMTIRFGGNERFKGKILMAPHGGIVRLDRANGAVVVFDGKDAWVSPADADWPRARFDVLTWAYFWAAPYKLNDAGAKLETTGTRSLRGKDYDTARLTFDAGTGDAPDDWYVVYRNPATGQLTAMAYIVTFGKDRATAEKEPHAIVYEDFQTFAGIPVPTRWTFWNWSEDQGIFGEPIGEVTLANVTFPEPPAGAFTKPDGATAAAMPE